MDDFEKFVDGEITEAEFLQRTSGISEEDRVKLNEKVATAQKEALAQVVALRKEGKRLADKNAAPVDTGVKFREEQLTKARSKFMQEFAIEEKDMSAYDATFKKLDEGNVDSDLIFKNFKKVYAYENPDSLLESRSKMKEFESDAEAFMENQASIIGSGSGGGEGEKKFSQKAREMVRTAKANGDSLTLEQAERYVTGGLRSKGI